MSNDAEMKRTLLTQMGDEIQKRLISKAYEIESHKDELGGDVNTFFALYGHTDTTVINAFHAKRPSLEKHFLWKLINGRHLNYTLLKEILDFVRENPRQDEPPELSMNDSMVGTMMYHFTRMALGEKLHVLSVIHALNLPKRKETP